MLVQLVHRGRPKDLASIQSPGWDAAQFRLPQQPQQLQQPCWRRVLHNRAPRYPRASTPCIVVSTLLCAAALLAAAALQLIDKVPQQHSHQAAGRTTAGTLQAVAQPFALHSTAGATAANHLGSTISAAAHNATGSAGASTARAAAGSGTQQNNGASAAPATTAAAQASTAATMPAPAFQGTSAAPGLQTSATAPAPRSTDGPIFSSPSGSKLPQLSSQDLLRVLAQLHSSWQSGNIRWPGKATAPAAASGPAKEAQGSQQPQAADASEERLLDCADSADAMVLHLTAAWTTWGGQGSTEQPPGADAHQATLSKQLQQLDHLTARLERCQSQSTAFLRRYTTATLLLLQKQQPAPAWGATARRAALLALLRLQLLHQRSAAARGAVEFTHVSKSGGSSLCHLASQSNCTSESFQLHRNCLVTAFNDEPAWTLPPGTYLGEARSGAAGAAGAHAPALVHAPNAQGDAEGAALRIPLPASCHRRQVACCALL